MNLVLIKSLLTIKNASVLNKEFLLLNYNDFVFDILKALYKVGLIQSYNYTNMKLKVYLKNNFNQSLTKDIKVISKKSTKIVLKYSDICKIKNQHHTLFISTSKGLLTLVECKKFKVGGVLLFLC